MSTTDYIVLSFVGGIFLGTCFGMMLGIAVSVKIEDIRRWLGRCAAGRSEREMRRRYTGPIDIQTGRRGSNRYGSEPDA